MERDEFNAEISRELFLELVSVIGCISSISCLLLPIFDLWFKKDFE